MAFVLALLGAAPAQAAPAAVAPHPSAAASVAAVPRQPPQSGVFRVSVQGEGSGALHVQARAGQWLHVTLESAHPAAGLNVRADDTGGEAMFVSTLQGNSARLRLPDDGRYTLQTYLVRSAARRGEKADITLRWRLAGNPLPPLSAAQDALLPGTRYHARARVACSAPGLPSGARCVASVLRRGRDGTATVVVQLQPSRVRRLLFVAGVPVAADSAQVLQHARDADAQRVKFGADEHYLIPNALLSGG